MLTCLHTRMRSAHTRRRPAHHQARFGSQNVGIQKVAFRRSEYQIRKARFGVQNVGSQKVAFRRSEYQIRKARFGVQNVGSLHLYVRRSECLIRNSPYAGAYFLWNRLACTRTKCNIFFSPSPNHMPHVRMLFFSQIQWKHETLRYLIYTTQWCFWCLLRNKHQKQVCWNNLFWIMQYYITSITTNHLLQITITNHHQIIINTYNHKYAPHALCSTIQWRYCVVMCVKRAIRSDTRARIVKKRVFREGE